MKLILMFIWLCSGLVALAQNEEKFYNQPDSTKISIHEEIIPPIKIKPEFYIPLKAINSFPLSLRLGLNTFSPNYEDGLELNTDLLYPSMPLSEQNKLSFLYTMLGAVQAGAVGYLAYKHIKKYGLLK